METFYNLTKFRNVIRVKRAIYPVDFIENMADSAAAHRKPRNKSCPDKLANLGSYENGNLRIF